MSHVHSHEVVHFSWCHKRDSCFCEVNRYLGATVCGLFFAGVQWWLSTRYAGSYGAEGDASHMIADSLFIFVSVFLAVWKYYDKNHTGIAEVIGILTNTLFLFLAALFILYHVFVGEQFTRFSIGWMAIAGLVGLIGNILQYRILESPDEEDAHTEKFLFFQ